MLVRCLAVGMGGFMESGELLTGLSYIVLSVALCLLGVYLGVKIGSLY